MYILSQLAILYAKHERGGDGYRSSLFLSELPLVQMKGSEADVKFFFFLLLLLHLHFTLIINSVGDLQKEPIVIFKDHFAKSVALKFVF